MLLPSLENAARVASVIGCLIAFATFCINYYPWLTKKTGELRNKARQKIGVALIRYGLRLLVQRRGR